MLLPMFSAEDPEAAAAIAALREKVQSQTSQLDSLRQKLANQAKEHETEVRSPPHFHVTRINKSEVVSCLFAAAAIKPRSRSPIPQ